MTRDMDTALAVLLVLALVGAFAIVGTPEYEDEVALEKRIAEVDDRKAMHPCDATMKTYGPGERWSGKQVEPECVARAKALPNWVLTSPLPEAK